MNEQQWDTDRVFTIPNILSFLRLAAIPLFVWLIVAGHDLTAIIVLAISAVTDWFDGYLARKLRQTSKLGSQLDPITDRLYILSTIFALLMRDIVPWWFVAVLLARDLFMIALFPFLRKAGRDGLQVNFVGKAGTFALMLAFPLILLGASVGLGIMWAHWAGWILGIAGAVLYWAAGLLYLRATVHAVQGSKVASIE